MESKLASVHDIAGQKFDFVIIGGGTAGLCLASRLSENPQISVAVLEAGKADFNDELILNPLGWLRQATNPNYDWSFEIAPQAHFDSKNLIWNRGKGLGGSSRMNFLLWTRPQREEIDAIERLGSPGWNWENFYKYSKASESFIPPKEPQAFGGYKDLYVSDSIGHDGPVHISFTQTNSGVEFPVQKSLEQLGVDTITDSLSGQIHGTFKALSDIDPTTGTRCYAAPAYLFSALDRPNLKVLPEAYVTKVVTENSSAGLVATAVEFEHGETIHKVLVGKEAILSAGTIKSPQVLELSGVGDKAVLEPLGIPVKLHLPAVGANLQDHVICTGLVIATREDVNVITSETFSDARAVAKLREQFPDAKGPLSLCLTGCTFLPLQTVSERPKAIIDHMESKINRNAAQYPPGIREQYDLLIENLKDPKLPDIEIVVFPFKLASDGQPVEETGKEVAGEGDPQKPFTVLMPSIGHPFSRGTVHVRSADPKQPPIVDPRYFDEETDFEILVDSFKYARKISQTEAFQKIVLAEIAPGPSVQTDEEIREYIKKALYTTWHSSGTCAMLPREKGGVVDPKLKVYGTSNIRVVDLSVVPLIPSVHTQATVYGLTEMVADIIKKTYEQA